MLRILLITFLIMVTNFNVAYGNEITKGDPTGDFRVENIIFDDGKIKTLKENEPILFLNGSAVNVDIIMNNGRALVPLRIISENLGSVVSWDDSIKEATIKNNDLEIVIKINKNSALVNNKEISLDSPAIIYNISTYVPLRFIAENLNVSVEYSEEMSGDYKYYYDTLMPVSTEKTIVRGHRNIIADEKYDFTKGISKEEAMIKAKEVCLEGLENFAKSTRESLVSSGEDANRFDDDYKGIENEINRMIYIGEVSRYYKFTIGPYDILLDRFTENLFFIVYQSSTIIKEVDVNDEHLYMNIFIVG